MFRLLAAWVVAAAALTGCSGDGVVIPKGWQSLKKCNYARTIPLEELATIGQPGCNMAGTKIHFTDGSTYKVGSVGATDAWSYFAKPGDAELLSDHFEMVNWGVPGVAIAEFERDGSLRKIWATTEEAAELHSASLAEQSRDLG